MFAFFCLYFAAAQLRVSGQTNQLPKKKTKIAKWKRTVERGTRTCHHRLCAERGVVFTATHSSMGCAQSATKTPSREETKTVHLINCRATLVPLVRVCTFTRDGLLMHIGHWQPYICGQEIFQNEKCYTHQNSKNGFVSCVLEHTTPSNFTLSQSSCGAENSLSAHFL